MKVVEYRKVRSPSSLILLELISHSWLLSLSLSFSLSLSLSLSLSPGSLSLFLLLLKSIVVLFAFPLRCPPDNVTQSGSVRTIGKLPKGGDHEAHLRMRGNPCGTVSSVFLTHD